MCLSTIAVPILISISFKTKITRKNSRNSAKRELGKGALRAPSPILLLHEGHLLGIQVHVDQVAHDGAAVFDRKRRGGVEADNTACGFAFARAADEA